MKIKKTVIGKFYVFTLSTEKLKNRKIASSKIVLFRKSSMFGTSFMYIQCFYFLTINVVFLIYIKLPVCNILLRGMLSKGIKKALSHESLNQ